MRMTSISAVQPIAISSILPTAVQILQQAEEAQAEAAEKEKPADLVEVANGMSGEPSKAAAQGLFVVNAAFIKMTEKSQFIGDVVEFIDSDRFKITDPLGRNQLKLLLSQQGWEFMQLVNQQYEIHGGLSRESLYALAIPQFIMKYREVFDAEEFEVGFKFKDVTGTPGVIVMIPDIEGNSTYRDFTKAIEEQRALAEKTGDPELLNQLMDEFATYKTLIAKIFDYDVDTNPMIMDIETLPDAPWIPKPPKPEPPAAEEDVEALEPGVLLSQIATAAAGGGV